MANLGTWRNVEPNIQQQAIDETSTTQLHKLRTEIQAKDTGSNALGEATFIYAQGVASTAVGDLVAIEDDGTTTRAVASGNYKLLGIAMSANVASQYGWYLIKGVENGNVATSFADNAQCYLTATAGRIDDTQVADDYIYGMKGAGAESSNLAKLELDRPGTTDGGEASYSSMSITTLSTTNIDAGASGTAGSVDIFPSTASKGKLTLACTDQTGDTAVQLNANAMGQATTVNLPDPGASASYLMQSTAQITLAEADVLDGATAGTQVASKAVVADANVNTGVSKVTELHIGASGSEVQLNATPAELNTKELFVTMADISTASSVWIPSPVAGTISKIYTIINGAIATADAVITAEINTVAVTDSTVTIAYSGSAAGDVDSSTPSAANTVAVGDKIELITNGASTNTVIATIVVVITL